MLNIVKAKYNFKDKAEAIRYVVSEYIDYEGEPELRPEFIEKIQRLAKQKSIHVKDFAARYGLKKATS